MSSESPPEADSEEGKLQGTNAGGQVRAAPVDVAAAMPSTDWERQVQGWGGGCVKFKTEKFRKMSVLPGPSPRSPLLEP